MAKNSKSTRLQKPCLCVTQNMSVSNETTKNHFFIRKRTTSTWKAFPVKVFMSEDWWSFCLWKPLGIGKVFSWLTYIFLKQTCQSKTRLEVTLMYTFFETTKISSGKLFELAFTSSNARFHWKKTSGSRLSHHNFRFVIAFEIATIFEIL